jgi:uncharacterized iron-regulated membrane protein
MKVRAIVQANVERCCWLAGDGHEVRWTPFLKQSRAQRWRSEVKYVHTGEIFGLGGQIVVFSTAMAALVQVVTGFGIAWKRWRARQERHSRTRYRTESRFSAPGNLRPAGRQAREETYGGR